ncbi:hypothetical protein CAOG_006409 [Capsaspora owczarzaki ATCC 30864]|uniref:DNA ligase n=2 Tax=Capsaspora owczarzaki (strain ATCC 30864) TaxID=595528 RepID=A0A0D2VWS6_CAPO3|nr:hypothetical protein CAOG_006409 [Capsaspora owczarzaki ATCC 30864]
MSTSTTAAAAAAAAGCGVLSPRLPKPQPQHNLAISLFQPSPALSRSASTTARSSKRGSTTTGAAASSKSTPAVVPSNAAATATAESRVIRPKSQRAKTAAVSSHVPMSDLAALVSKMLATDSVAQRRVILGEVDDKMAALLRLIYNPNIRFGVTSLSLVKSTPAKSSAKDVSASVKAGAPTPNTPASLFELLSELSTGQLRGSAATDSVWRFIAENKGHQRLILQAIDKDLQFRLLHEGIDKALPSQSSRAKVDAKMHIALAFNYNDYVDRVDSLASTPRWYASRKLDGIRSLTQVTRDKEGQITFQFLSRSGKPLSGFDLIPEHIRRLIEQWELKRPVLEQILSDRSKNVAGTALLRQAVDRLPAGRPFTLFLDGEAFVANEKGDESLSAAMSAFRSTKLGAQVAPSSSKSVAFFDLLSLEEMAEGESQRKVPFEARQLALQLLLGIPLHQPAELAVEPANLPVLARPPPRDFTKSMLIPSPLTPELQMVRQIRLEKASDIQALRDAAAATKWEGFMLRKNVPYDGRRTPDLLKVKSQKEAEFVVTAVENGPMRLGGSDVEEIALAAVTIDYEGHKVNVGSGFTNEQRRYFAKHPEAILGKEITVRFSLESTNKKGGKSLRFPIFMVLHESGKRDV